MPAPDAKAWTLKVALSQRPWSFVASICMAATFVCNGLTPVVVGHAVDEAIAALSLARLGFWLIVLAGLYLVAVGVSWVARSMLIRSQQLVSHDLRTMVTDRIQDPRGFAGRERTAGGLLSIASSDTTRVGEIVMMTVMPVAEAASITYGAIMMFTINPWLSLATLVGGPLLVVVALRVGRPLQRRSVARQQAIAQTAATATDVVQGLRILKGLGAIVTVRGRYDEVSGTAYARTIEANAAEARLNGVTEAAGALFVAGLGIAAGVLALNGVVTIGQLITVVGLTQFLITPMTMFGRNLASRWASAEASGQRIREVLGAGFERGSEADAVRTAAFVDALPTGLTVVRGIDHALVSRLESLPRHRVIVAPHASDLFDGNVADNVHPDRMIAERALYVASCDDIPEGPDKRVGEGGRMLSGGQRQRVALARAVAFDPEVLVLQDPTTAVDSVTEQKIADRVAKHRADKITLVFSEAPAWNAVAANHLHAEDLLAAAAELGGERAA
ncbi:putative ABC transport system ATP-binding protein [Microlunatus soli]|uniref:Putative ABC transport system ATP-binding protein n=2 Tax=Microlunatus soli TaxID=630515 RepID=A0A1H1QTT5_9ACTN|nr:putative ABC transport system ATP-binding protein [Microlunatus soli]